MITLNQAIEHAAKHDELDEKLCDLFQASAERALVLQQEQSLKAYMQENAAYIARCEKAIREIDNILNESTKYLRGKELCLAS